MGVIHKIAKSKIVKIDKDRYELDTSEDLINSIDTVFKYKITSARSFVFTATSVKTLKEYLSHTKFTYDLSLKLLQNIGNQLVHLERNNKTIAFYSLDDIIVASDDTFFFYNEKKIFDINNKKISIDIPLSFTNSFLPPELMKKKTLPMSINYKSSYYSLASLLIYCLLNKCLEYEKNVTDTLKPIVYTSLYWFLLRCLKKTPEKRKFLYI